jgi:IstB-like ATP binding protein
MLSRSRSGTLTNVGLRATWRVRRLLAADDGYSEVETVVLQRSSGGLIPAKAARQFRTLLDGSFLDRKENVLVFGNPGSGKSHLLMALAQELVVGRERKMHFTRCALLMQDLLAAKRDLRLSREIKRLGVFWSLDTGC